MTQSQDKLEARRLSAWQYEALNEGATMEDLEMDPLFVALVLRLPKIDCEWSTEARMAWMRMFYAIADSLHPESVERAPEKPTINPAETVLTPAPPTEALPEALTQSLPAQEPKSGPQQERKYFVLDKDATRSEAAGIVAEMIRQAGKPGRVWYNKGTGRVRLCAEDYAGEDGDVFVGVYGTKVKSTHIERDIEAKAAT